MGRMSDYLIWLEEKGYAVWNDRIDGYDFPDDPYAHFEEYQQENANNG